MRELARIQFRGDKKVFIDEWNARSNPKIEYGVVALYKDEHAYEQMRQLFAALTKEHDMTWLERVEVEYSEQELKSFELLALHITGRAGEGDNKLANVYVVEPVCGTCGRVEYRQMHNLVLDFSTKEVDPFENGYFQHDLCETDFDDEVVVSEKFKSLLEENKVPGVSLRPVESISADIAISIPYYQLLVEQQIGPLVEPTHIQRLDRCDVCNQYKQVLLDAWPRSKEGEFYFRRSSYTGQWIMKTSDRFGRIPNFASKFVINQRLYRIWKEHNVTGFWVQPVHLID